MKTYHIRYRSHDKLNDFLYDHEIVDSSDILIQIFSHELHVDKIKEVTAYLHEKLPSARIMGTTTDGEILDSRILTKNIVLSFTLFEETKLKTRLMPLLDDDFTTGRKLAEAVVTEDTKAMIVFATSKDINAQAILEGIVSHRKGIVIAGALCGDQGRFKNGYVFDHAGFCDRGIVAVGLSGKNLVASVHFTSQWEPVGREFVITKSKENRIISVDKMSVKGLYEKYLGTEIAQELPLSGLLFPFVRKDKNGIYRARSVLSDPGDGSLVFGANMKEGDKIQIGFGDAKKMLVNARDILSQINEKPSQTLFVYASGGRRRFMKQYAHYEIEPFGQIAPVSGFYGYGEFFADAKESLFLNQSLSVLSLSETNAAQPKKLRIKEPLHQDDELQIMRALSHIAKVSSQELQDLNQKLEARVKDEVQKSRKKDSILIHNAKLAQMGEMMSLIAHQWRQPLNAISATSTGLHVKIELGKYDETFFLSSLDKVEQYVKYLSATIDDFANFFKPSKKTEETTAKQLIDKALFIMSASLHKNNVEAKVENKSENPIKTYPNEVIQVLINLVKNAENILLKRQIPNPKIIIEAYEKNDKHIFTIKDNAGGVESNILDKIFEPYFTTKNHESSTGLGLYMSKFIIEESCRGKLDVTNAEEGAVFTITI